MPRKLTARQLAVDILEKIDAGGAYANLELDKSLRNRNLPAKDKAFATELVYGALRWRTVLDKAIAKAGRRKLAELSPKLLAILRITAYQLFYLDGVPAHAAVYESVELAKRLINPGAAGYANAVARQMQRNGKPAPVGSGPARLADEWSHPLWLVERWINVYGELATIRLLAANQAPAPITLRVNAMRCKRVELFNRLQDAGIAVEMGATPDAIRVLGGVEVTHLPGYAEGLFMVQDESSQLAALALAPEAGEVIADLCSAPGGKTTHIAQLIGDVGRVYALESHPHRARLLSENITRLGFRCVQVVNTDSRTLPDELHHQADRVLLDAPCTGTGVLRRRVDLRWRLRPDDLQELVPLQRQLLAAAASALRPGGRLVYSTCSVDPAENVDQVETFLAHNPDFHRCGMQHLADAAPQLCSLEAHPELAHGELQLLPETGAHDGFFIACLEKQS